MKNRTWLVLLSSALFTPLAGAGEPPSGPPPGAGQHWAAIDTNGDGAISLEEAKAGAPRMAEHFSEIDTNGDGKITRDEMRAMHAKMHGSGQGQPGRHFASADANGDGVLDAKEVEAGMPWLAGHFKEIDADGSGTLTHEEIRNAMRAHPDWRRSQQAPPVPAN